MRDISERRSEEEQLDRLHYHNQVILNSAGEGIYGVDRGGRLTFVNPAAANMFGWEAEAMIGRSMHPLVFPPDLCEQPFGELRCPIADTIRDGEIREQVDSAFWRKDGTSFPVEYVSTPISERGDIAGAVVVFKDTTDRKRAEAQLQDSLRRLRKLSGRMEGIREVHIGETGWASKSNEHYGNDGSKATDEYKSALYYDLMREWTNKNNISCFYFEAFDENWKDASNPDGSENHFGLINLQSQAKYVLWKNVDKGTFKGSTRDGKQISKTYNGDEKALWEDVKTPNSILKN